VINKCEDRGQQLLFHAVTTSQDARLLKLYLQHGGDPNIHIGFDRTALDYASSTGRQWAIKLLQKSTDKVVKPSRKDRPKSRGDS
jgi:ankyrin repeat protein